MPADGSPRRRFAAASRLALGVVPVVLAWSAYRGLLDNYFYNDDFEILYDLGNTGPFPFLFELHIGHGLIVRNALFWVVWHAFGVAPTGWFATALAVHLINTALVFLVVDTLTAQTALAALVATLFGMARTHEGTLGWCSASGHAMAAVPLLLLLLSVARHRRSRIPPASRTLGGWAALAAVSSQCFGVGLAAAPALVVAVRWLVPALEPRRYRRLVVATAAIVFGVYGAQRLAFPPLPGALISADRPPPLLALPQVVKTWLLLHVDLGFLVSPPVATITPGSGPSLGFSMAATGLLLLALARPRSGHARRWIGGLLGVVAAAYFPIALTRSVFQAIPAEAGDVASHAQAHSAIQVFAPNVTDVLRYHYVTQALVAVALGAALADLSGRSRQPRTAAFCFLGTIAALAWLLGHEPYRLDHHDADRQETTAALAGIDRAAEGIGDPVLIPNVDFRPIATMLVFEPLGRFPGIAGVFVAFRSTDDVDGRPIRFVSRNAAEYAFAQRGGGRIANLLLPPSPPAHSGASGSDR